MLLYIIIISSGCVCIVVMLYFLLCRLSNMKLMTVEPGLRVYSKIMSTLFLSIPLSTMTVSIFALFGNDFNARSTYLLRLFVSFSTPLIDITVFVISIDCAVASRKIDRTSLLRKKIHGYCAAMVSIFYATCFPISFYLTDFTNGLFTSLVKMSLDIVCLVTELILLAINNRRKKKVPFAYQLSIRHNLVRNIKLLQFICPFLFLITVTNVFGPAVYIYNKYTNIMSVADSVKTNYIIINATILAVIVLYAVKSYNKAKVVQKTVSVIELEKQRVTVDHFQKLKDMWK